MKCPLTTKKVNVKAPPDRWGNKVFEQWAAQNHIPLRQLSPVDKLSFIGKRGMGALEYAPATAGFETSSSVQIDSLYQLAKKLFQEREKAIVLSGEALNLQSLYEVGTSPERLLENPRKGRLVVVTPHSQFFRRATELVVRHYIHKKG